MLVTERALWCACQWGDLAVLLPFFPIGQAWALACQRAPGILDLAISSLRSCGKCQSPSTWSPAAQSPEICGTFPLKLPSRWKQPLACRKLSWDAVPLTWRVERNWLQLAGSSGNPVLWSQVTVSALCYFWTVLQLVSLRRQSNTRKGVSVFRTVSGYFM